MIHPPGFKSGADAGKFWEEKKVRECRDWNRPGRSQVNANFFAQLTWDQKQDEADVADLPGALWSQDAQFDGKVVADKSQGVNGAARDPIGATPYASRRDVEDVGEEEEE